MGLFNKLLGGGNATLTVMAEPAEVAPGGELNVRYDVGGELDEKDRGVRVGLAGSATYKVKMSRKNTEGNIVTTEEWQSYELHKEEQTFPAQAGPGQASFTVPTNVPPSSAGAVAWSVSARVDRERGKDAVESSPLRVRHHIESQPATRSSAPSNEGLTLEDVPAAVRAGETLTGTLSINVSDDVSVTAVRIRLHRKLAYTAEPQTDGTVYAGGGGSGVVPSNGHITDDVQMMELDLSGKRDFTAGTIERFPFSLPVNAAAESTTSHTYASVDWRIEAVLDRRMRGDLSVEAPLVVL